MPLTGLKLFGCTVKSFSPSLGYGTEASSVKVSLVQDTDLGDYFLPSPIGSLVYVTFSSLNFWGILKRWNKSSSASGFPTYEVEIHDPRSLLEGVEVILSGYNGVTYGVPNLLNVYGYYENVSFGSSGSNETGMPWTLIKEAIHNMTTTVGGTNYGGPLNYKGYFYAVDLSQIPDVPSYYRVGGQSATLMDLIQRVCNDAGCDFFVDVEPETTIIRVRTVSRRYQPPTGYIQYLIDSAVADGLTVESQTGIEAINQTTSMFLVGAPVETMYETVDAEVIHPYFGKDVNGNPILSYNAEIGNPFSLTTNLNASEVQDIIGSYYYNCTALEMCCAMASRDTWDTYISIFKPEIATLIGLMPAFRAVPAVLGVGPGLPADLINLGAGVVNNIADSITSNVLIWTSQRMYNLVRKAAEQFLGKKFLVEIPFVFTSQDLETGKISTSYEVSSSGYLESGLPPLGLHPVYKNIFTDQDDKFRPYALYNRLAGVDLSRVTTEDFVIDTYNSNGIYVSMDVGQEIIFIDEFTPCVEITINNPLYSPPTDGTGAGIAAVAAIFQATPAQAADFFKKLAGGNVIGRISPIPAQPTYVTIPLKSNILNYGPWFAVGAEGKLEFRSDNSLAPWNYGGSALMNLAATAVVSEAVTFQQYSETGSVRIVEEPRFNLGDQLEINTSTLLGPNLTAMDISYSDAGVTTNYRFQTFTPKFGTFSKDNIDRLRKISLKSREARRELLDLFNKASLPRAVVNDKVSILSSIAQGQLPSQFQRNSPHSVFMGFVEDTSMGPRVAVTTFSDKEIAHGISSTDSTMFDKSAMMSITGLIRPINTNTTSTYLASYETPNANYKSSAKGDFLDPFKSGNDIDLYTYGNTYADAHAYLNGGPTNARGFALRGPILISGWGTSVDNVFEPAGVGDYLRESWFWKTGPVDLLWDNERKVWTPHGMMMGHIASSCSGNGGSTECVVYDDSGVISGRATNRTVYNFFPTSVPADSKIMAAWIPEAQKWYIIAAECK
jgi:hypothetical protein